MKPKAHMTIELKPEQEQVIGQAIQAGLLRDAEDIVNVGVEAIKRKLDARQTVAPAPPSDADQWSKDLHVWIQSHPTTTPLLSDEAISRDSIYGTRGL